MNISIFKRKAAENYAAARQLVKTAPNAAATRAYYALYQAIVGEFEEKGIKPEVVDPLAKFADQDEDKLQWRHSVVRQNGGLIGLTPRESSAVRRAYDARIQADYKSLCVDSEKVKSILDEISGILEGLGVKVV